uniref:Uncharacterized protein n=1 Tax=Hyaloperonospora arabidopsidis (strain Emoy2) TaxID=559515 RepID=M4C460_HYAAE
MAFTPRRTGTLILVLDELHERGRYRDPIPESCSSFSPHCSWTRRAFFKSWYEVTKSAWKAIRRYKEVIRVPTELSSSDGGGPTCESARSTEGAWLSTTRPRPVAGRGAGSSRTITSTSTPASAATTTTVSVGRSAGTSSVSAMDVHESTTKSSGPFFGHGRDVSLLDSRFANVGRTKVGGDAGGHSWEVDRLYGIISNSGFGHRGVRYLVNGCLVHAT